MNERARNLKDILKSIIANEEESKEFEKLKTISEIYEKCIAKGYKGGMEEFTSDLMTLELLPKEMIKIIEEKLNEVSGGKLDVKKGIASILSGLTVMSAGGININATQVAPKEASKKAPVSSKKNPFINKSFLNRVDRKAIGVISSVGTGLLAAGTIGYYMVRSLENISFEELIGKIEKLSDESKDYNFQDSMSALLKVLRDISNDKDESILRELIFKSSRTDAKPISLPVYYNESGTVNGKPILNRTQALCEGRKFFARCSYNPGISHYSKDVLANLSEFASKLQSYIGFGLWVKEEKINFNDYKQRNLMGEIYFIQSCIRDIISATSIDENKVKKLKEIDKILSDFEIALLQKVNSMNWDWYGSK